MQLSFYNEDNAEYFGIVDLPNDYAEFLISYTEKMGYSLEDYLRLIIMEAIDDRVEAMGSRDFE